MAQAVRPLVIEHVHEVSTIRDDFSHEQLGRIFPLLRAGMCWKRTAGRKASEGNRERPGTRPRDVGRQKAHTSSRRAREVGSGEQEGKKRSQCSFEQKHHHGQVSDFNLMLLMLSKAIHLPKRMRVFVDIPECEIRGWHLMVSHLRTTTTRTRVHHHPVSVVGFHRKILPQKYLYIYNKPQKIPNIGTNQIKGISSSHRT